MIFLSFICFLIGTDLVNGGIILHCKLQLIRYIVVLFFLSQFFFLKFFLYLILCFSLEHL